ncbi:hypothetical protein DS745_04870 [Anaerobacillus alkaliphilus]|uniref:SRPBCC family protein n=1 Tax=Anaerobacillus alkaliphilus TaxID=1548597 RepID=A0A4Q0VX15_9BACI|nr:SRPBCC family protein [Anaerobacillus alkaliphilus]RXJ02920.1 hypothetical protein DS745_04870 [Anaerobacillus alkaliphilus]
MKTVEHSVVINKPVDEVFSFIEDLQRRPEWEPGVVGVAVLKGCYNQPGAVIEVTNQVLGKKMVAEAEVIEYIENERVICRAEKPFYHEIANIYEDMDGKTKFTRRATAQFEKGAAKLASTLIMNKLEKTFKKTVENAKEVIERE